MSSRDAPNKCRIYVGNLPNDIRERELDDLFEKVRAQFHFACPINERTEKGIV